MWNYNESDVYSRIDSVWNRAGAVEILVLFHSFETLKLKRIYSSRPEQRNRKIDKKNLPNSECRFSIAYCTGGIEAKNVKNGIGRQVQIPGEAIAFILL